MMRILSSDFFFEPKENDLLMPGMAMSKATTEIQILFDHIISKSRNTTALKMRISQNAKPKTVVQMKSCGLI